MHIILEGDEIKSAADLHRQLKDALNFPDYYGANLDALWDCLTAWVEMPLTITWANFETSKSYLGADADKIIKLFEEAELEINGFKIEC